MLDKDGNLTLMGLLELDELQQELLLRNVPQTTPHGRLTLWERVEEFAQHYQDYPKIEPTPEPTQVFELSKDQQRAWAKIVDWLERDDPYFVLQGYAGTGKTTLLRKLLELTNYAFEFCAPTNKAAKVMAQLLDTETRTIHSFLGLKMAAHEDGQYLSYPDNPPYIPQGTIIIIDESSMIDRKLMEFIRKARRENDLRVMFVGDPAQLNPIGEKISPAWVITNRSRNRAKLRQIMRFDNQLLELSVRVRKYLKAEKLKRNLIGDNHSKHEGVHLLRQRDFERKLFNGHKVEYFIDSKVIAWRNKTVNEYNKKIRRALGFERSYQRHDRLMLAAPYKQDDTIIASIDDEGEVMQADKTTTKIRNGPELPIWSVLLKTDQHNLNLKIPIANDDTLIQYLNKLAEKAKAEKGFKRKLAWREFWQVKDSFHQVRYAYALTAHRVQGTTLRNVYVDQRDILANSVTHEALRALYVSVTRPTNNLYTY